MIRVGIYVYTGVWVCICMYVSTCVCIYVYVCMYVYVYIIYTIEGDFNQNKYE